MCNNYISIYFIFIDKKINLIQILFCIFIGFLINAAFRKTTQESLLSPLQNSILIEIQNGGKVDPSIIINDDAEPFVPESFNTAVMNCASDPECSNNTSLACLQDDNPDYWVGLSSVPFPRYELLAAGPPFTGQELLSALGLGGPLTCELVIQPVGILGPIFE